jgi:hypothetical protein
MADFDFIPDEQTQSQPTQSNRARGSMTGRHYYTGSESGQNEATLDDFTGALRKGVRSIEIPATIALDRFASAATGGLSIWADAIGTKKPGETLKQSLDRVRARRAQEAEDYPKLTGVAQTVGDIAPAFFPGGRNAQIALQGGLGALDTYTASPDTTVGDALKSGAIRATGAAVGAGVSKLTENATNAIQSRMINQFAKESDQTTTEALKDLQTSAGQEGTWEILKDPVMKMLKGGAGVGTTAIAAGAGGYAGSKIAPVFGVSPDLGAMLGFQLGGGIGGYAAFKKKLFQESAKGVADAAGYGSYAYPGITSVMKNLPTTALAGAATQEGRKADSNVDFKTEDGIDFVPD